MTRSTRGLGGGMVAAIALLTLAGAPPARASTSFSCTATGAVVTAERNVAPFTQANPAGTPCRTAAARSAGALFPDGPSATILARTRARAGRAVARVRDRRVSLTLDGHTYTAALVRAEATVRCHAGVPVVSSTGRSAG